jgi:Icc-related predicted phosphoesterase
MTILHISDTHSKHHELPPLPEADVIVHSGDFTFAGSEEEAYDFMNWFCGLQYTHKIFISGNHDMCMYGAVNIDGLPDNVHYLCNSEVVIEGYKFFGIPMFMEDVNDGSLDNIINGIPNGVDILVTHQPPFGIGDIWHKQHLGDKTLCNRINELPSLKAHLFGHQHDANSLIIQGNTIFSNATVLDCQYNLIASPRVIEI